MLMADWKSETDVRTTAMDKEVLNKKNLFCISMDLEIRKRLSYKETK